MFDDVIHNLKMKGNHREHMKIWKALIEGRLIKTTIKYIKKRFTQLRKLIDKILAIPAIFIMSRTTPIEKNKILCITFRGEYDCNAKWIAEEILRRNLPYQIVWTVVKGANLSDMPESIIKARRGSYDYYKHLASAKIIIDNGVGVATLMYKKKKEQILIQTWHGSIGIKKFSKDTNKNKSWVFRATLEGLMTDYCLSNSTFEDKIFRDTFWNKSKILQLGHARNDVLCETDTNRVKAIREKVTHSLGFDENSKICLYAPTFRDDGDMRPYEIDYAKLQEALEARFGGSWVILTRFHWRLIKKLKKKNYHFGENVINATNYTDIQELISCTDVGITDYSSWICDYLLTRRPGFLFATDMTEYEEKDREFVYPLESLPFPLSVNNQELIDNILNFDDSSFEDDCNLFLKDKGCIDDGCSADRIVNVIERLISGEKV